MAYFLLLFLCNVLSVRANFFFDKPDGIRTTPELLDKYGYPCEAHTVITEDGYILNHYRVPYGKLNSNQIKKPVVILQHGMHGSSTDWILQDPTHSLAYKLADAGCDVWLMNVRGNVYSKKHIKKLNRREYWNFSWNEIGIHDIPTTIDYVLKITKQKQLCHIGHSQGTTSMYVLLSKKPEYNKKLHTHLSYSPVAYLEHFELNSILVFLIKNGLFTLFSEIIGGFPFIPQSWVLQLVIYIFCQPYMPTSGLCKTLVYKIAGHSPNELNSTALPIVMPHYPAGAGFRQFLHYGQLITTSRFQEYDHGTLKNLQLYGRPKPNEYNISNIKIPIHGFYGENDIVKKVDVENFLSKLHNVQQFNMGECNHLDYLVSNTVAKRLYDITLKILSKYVKIIS